MEADKEYVIKKLGFTNEEFDKIMALPIKDYRDYPNNAFLMHRYGSVVKVARKFLRKV
ncbi:MAG: LPS biosynthesis protein WbpG [Parcubacteria group bacterium GW2011_GWC1_38_6]|nr:MAG: LPS biosynthesis protein WbpG [Parcubacteria group bacterium GW2011_GWC1_38_6]